MSSSIGAGDLDQRLEVLELRETGPGTGVWEWVSVRKTWGQVTPQDKRNLFSTAGIGARDAALVLRKQSLTLDNALRCGGQHLFLTTILPRGRGHLDVGAALVALTACVGRPVTAGMGAGNRPDRQEGPPIRFPGVLTEKYMGYTREDTHAVNASDLVLVTPKAIVLSAGDLVDARGETWNVRVVHTLDPHKNEYEIHLGKDV